MGSRYESLQASGQARQINGDIIDNSTTTTSASQHISFTINLQVPGGINPLDRSSMAGMRFTFDFLPTTPLAGTLSTADAIPGIAPMTDSQPRSVPAEGLAQPAIPLAKDPGTDGVQVMDHHTDTDPPLLGNSDESDHLTEDTLVPSGIGLEKKAQERPDPVRRSSRRMKLFTLLVGIRRWAST
ncbi:hypothetical protein BJ508DRAFT_329982 [Ascobolus immersus RN42]|uniref:Uncharacterized protein n=1 Tax=Ascobolus immersus RN42 TaxID=1160509 RepID=A0A3N4I7F0_ASCIM|nr:hypothetical protein BJ508DRAFT_329982 [Ascobolus immersus RN42]